MDVEFIEFLDKKFQKVSQEIQGVQLHLGEKIDRLTERVDHLEESMDSLARSVDRFVKLHEDVITEQKALRTDIDRIKVVLKEKLGVQL